MECVAITIGIQPQGVRERLGAMTYRGAALPWSLAAQSNKLRHTEAVVLVRPSAPAASAFSHDGGGTTPGNPLVLGWHAALPFRVTFPNE